jgi:hypothetical protein
MTSGDPVLQRFERSLQRFERSTQSLAYSRAAQAIGKLSMRTPEPTPGNAEAMTRWVERQKAFEDAIAALRALDPEA